MHKTLHPNVKGNIDTVTVENGSVDYKGWLFHEKYNVVPIHIKSDDTTYIVNIKERPDVSKFYNNDNINKCGFNIMMPNINFKLFAYFDNNWYEIFEFKKKSNFDINKKQVPTFVVADNFYAEPDKVREFALSKEFKYNPNYHKGKRTNETYLFDGMKERFEELIGTKIKNWTHYPVHGCFQYCIAGDQLVYHMDLQDYAGVLFLTPDAPPEAGTKFFRSKNTKKMSVSDASDFDKTFKTGFYDKTQFDEVDTVGNVYNRLVLFNARLIHAASEYFGTTKDDGRLFQLFFFDLE